MDLLLHLNWLAVGQIILIDILLGGDNAIVIALACRSLPPHLRLRGILWGSFGAIALRIVLVAFAVTLLQLPYLKIVGGALLFWIGVKLLAEEGGHGEVPASERLTTAIRTIIVADLVMSIDNVVAVASAAEQASGEHQLLLVAFGILISIPFIIWGSTIVLGLMERFPVIVTLGAGLLGYLAATMILSDEAIAPWLAAHLALPDLALPAVGISVSVAGLAGAAAVIGIGTWLTRRQGAPD